MINKLSKEQVLEKNKIREKRIKERLEQERLKAERIKEKARIDAKTFKAKFKKELNTAILAAFGLLIALVWKDVITNFVNSISEKSPFHGALISAIGVTVICVLGIMLSSRLLEEKEHEKEDEKK